MAVGSLKDPKVERFQLKWDLFGSNPIRLRLSGRSGTVETSDSNQRPEDVEFDWAPIIERRHLWP